MSAGIRRWLPGEVFAGQTRQVRVRDFYIIRCEEWQVGEKGRSKVQGMQGGRPWCPEREPERVDGRGPRQREDIVD